MVNQSKLDCLPAEEIATLEIDLKAIEEQNKALATELRNASAGKASGGFYMRSIDFSTEQNLLS